jgi:hypothetical protein
MSIESDSTPMEEPKIQILVRRLLFINYQQICRKMRANTLVEIMVMVMQKQALFELIL